MGDIVIDRGSTTVMKLDDDEQRMFDEITLEQPRDSARVPRPAPRHRAPPQKFQPQENLESFANPAKQSAPPPAGGTFGGGDIGSDEDFFDDEDDGEYGGDGGQEQQEFERPRDGYSNVDEEKSALLNKLKRLEAKGFSVNKRLNAYSHVDDLRREVERITHDIDVERSIKFSRRMLVACVTGLEFLNRRYSPFDLQLDNWAESVHENIDDYDGVFERLYEKYHKKMEVAPEVELILMLGSSAFMFHLSNSLFKAMPNMNDVIKQNPDLVKSMMSAVANTSAKQASSQAQQGGEYEMSGPGIDLGALMGGLGMPPAPVNTSREVVDDDDDVSDIVSEVDIELEDDDEEQVVKEVALPPAKKKGGGRKTAAKKKVEINL